MSGKTCVVTGATSGIGLEVAAGLASQGALVVMVSRTTERGMDARQAVAERAANGGRADLVLADLSSQREIRQLAAQIHAFYPSVDVLVNNAGLLIGRRELTDDRIERTFALNHLAYFLLTNLLLDRLKASAPSRIINTSSEAHWGAKWDWENLQGEKKYTQLRAYCNSKLANLFFTYELARRLEGTGVTANAVHPGLVRSRFGNTATRAMRTGIRLAAPFAISNKRGAKTTLYAAASPDLEGATGRYLKDSRVAESSAESHDAAAQQRLWELSEQLTGFAPPP